MPSGGKELFIPTGLPWRTMDSGKRGFSSILLPLGFWAASLGRFCPGLLSRECMYGLP